jgi:hypothetical protein
MGETNVDGEGDLPTLRTYKRDVADSLHGETPEAVSANVQEEIKKETLRVAVRADINKSKLFVIGIIVLMALGAGALAYIFFIHQPPPVVVITPTEEMPTPLIPAEVRTKVSTNDLEPRDLYKEISSRVGTAALNPNSIEELIPVKTSASSNTTEWLSAEDFMLALGLKVPEKLPRFIKQDFMFGIYTFRETTGFMLLRPTSFGPVFAELLSWEKDMPEELFPLLSGKTWVDDSHAAWRDEVIKNIDVRSYRNSTGGYLLIYGFLPDKETLVIASGLDTFTEVVLRSQTPRSIQK